MSNENLKGAVSAAGLTVEQFAEIVEVDPKTAQRWIGGRVPRARNRQMIARALDRAEHELWPDDLPLPVETTPAADPRHHGAGDVVGSWGDASDDRAPDPVAFIAEGDAPVDVLDDSMLLVRNEPLIIALVHAAQAGRAVRIATAYPHRRLAPLVEQPGVEVRVFDGGGQMHLLRSGPRMLFSFAVRYIDTPWPVLKLEHLQPDGVYDRLADFFEDTWEATAEHPIATVQYFNHHLFDGPGLDEDEDADLDLDQPACESVSPDDEPEPDSSPAPSDETIAPRRSGRRWPGRPE